MRKVNVSKEKLEKLYIEEEMSMKKISEELGVGYNTVKRKMTEYNIPKRSREESIKKAFKKKHEKTGYKLTDFNCPECGVSFKIKNSLVDRAVNHFCSASCSSTYYNKINPISPKKGKEIPCKNCGEFVYRPKHRIEGATFSVCSNECRVEWIKKTGMLAGGNNTRYSSFEHPCYTCGKSILLTPSRSYERNYCSVKCMSLDYQQRMIGEANPFWKGGWDNEYGPHWKRISLEVRARDNFTCQRCLRAKNELVGTELLHAHHIIPFREFQGDTERAHAKENLVTLCSRCHPIVEKNGIDFEWNTVLNG